MDQGCGCDFVDYVDMCGVDLVRGGCAGGLRNLHGDVWDLPHACAAGSSGEGGAEHGGSCSSFEGLEQLE